MLYARQVLFFCLPNDAEYLYSEDGDKHKILQQAFYTEE